MPARRFRCYRCNPPLGHEFDGGEPRCPSCQAGPPAVQELTLVHLLFEDSRGAIAGHQGSRWTMACQPGKPLRNYPHRPMPATGDPLAVTCPACRQSEAYRKAAEAFGLDGVTASGDGCC